MPWMWCLAYTVALPREVKVRRRREIESHLWESFDAGHGLRALAGATLRGMAADLTWAASECTRAAVRGLATPTPYVGGAIVVVVQGAFVWSAVAPGLAGTAQGVSLVTALGLLLVAGGLALWRHRPRS